MRWNRGSLFNRVPEGPFILNREGEIFYEVGWSCDNALLLDTGKNRYFITDGRYTTEAKEGVKGAEVVEARDLVKKARELILRDGVKRLVVDPLNWSRPQLEKLEEVVQLRPFPRYSHKKREVKTPEEIELIRESARLNRESFRLFLKEVEGAMGRGEELDELELAYRFKTILTQRGRRPVSFEPIVAINENSAKPHAVPGEKRLERGAVLLIDAGIKFRGYCSDRTRTVAVGEKLTDDKLSQQFQADLINKVYNLVKEAQLRAIEAVKVGVPIGELDRIARQVIADGGFGDYFVHSLGHGVGIDIHELPVVNSRNREVVREGMVFTIEPGIYLPGQFGVRIEDIVIVNHNGEVEIV